MGKKDKRVDKAKVEAKKLRHAEKQSKLLNKRAMKESKDTGEIDIESMIKEFSTKDTGRTAVSILPCSQPSPRANFSLTALPGNDFLLFGGEFCDGMGTVVYNELYRWNVEKDEWKLIESLNTPPPRCSHQAVFFKDKLFIFGGEYATLDQFHHYRDFWSFDIKTNSWTQIQAAGDVPSARSGHRMAVWRNYLVLFGGFYEALREVKFHNDTYLYSFQEERWMLLPQKPSTQLPKPRSAVQMFVHAADDSVFIYGGYSREKIPGVRKEGKIHEDLWVLSLRGVLGTASGGAKQGGGGFVDLHKAVWQRLSKKGSFPSPRCGCGVTIYKNKALVFGGVYDDEGLQHSIASTFFSDMYAFDMETKRWHQLGVKSKAKTKMQDGSRKARKLLKSAAVAEMVSDDKAEGNAHNSGNCANNVEDGNENISECSGEDSACSGGEGEYVTEESSNSSNCNREITGGIHKPRNLFGYIDENGEVVYVELEPDDCEYEDTAHELDSMFVASILKDSAQSSDPSASIAAISDVNIDIKAEKPRTLAPSLTPTRPAPDATHVAAMVQILNPPDVHPLGESSYICSASLDQKMSQLHRYFLNRAEPSPRINPCLMIRGHTLYVYGGVCELGDVEVTLDDCWSLDLNKRDSWRRVLQGSMHSLVWRGEDLEGGTETETSLDGDGRDDDEEGQQEEEEEEEDEEDETIERPSLTAQALAAAARFPSASLLTSTRQQTRPHFGPTSSSSFSRLPDREKANGGIRAEMQMLRTTLESVDLNRTPVAGENLKAFYARTCEYWSAEMAQSWRDKAEDVGTSRQSKDEAWTEKEIKRGGFLLAEARFNKLAPHLARLNEIELQQKQEEGEGREGEGGGQSKGKYHRGGKVSMGDKGEAAGKVRR